MPGTESRPIRVRFAPSPTGELHVGSARTALYNWLFARKEQGSFIIRIEDTDQARYVSGAMERFFDNLKWLGIDWDEGPDVGGRFGPYIQSERLAAYRAAAEALVSEGKAYHCYCTPARLEEMRQAQMTAHQPPKYDRRCLKELTADSSQLTGTYVIRLLVPEGKTKFEDIVRGEVTFDNSQIDDQILLKSDGFPTYHLAVVLDDQAMGISHVIRGEEWISSTPKHLMLYRAFGWEPPIYVHLPLILNHTRQKLSKRRDGAAVWISTYRKLGYLPEALMDYLALVGWNPGTVQEKFSREELIRHFSLARIHASGGIFDDQKLRSLNQTYLKELSDDDLSSKLRDGGFLDELTNLTDAELSRWIGIIRGRLQILSEFPDLLRPLLNLVDYPADLLVFRKSDRERTRQGLATALACLEKQMSWESADELSAALTKAVAETGLANGDVFWPVRVALSGLEASPSPAELLWALGKDESVKRVHRAHELLRTTTD